MPVFTAWEERLNLPTGWQFILLGFVGLALIAAVHWRHRLLATLAMVSSFAAPAVIFLWLATLHNRATIQVVGTQPQKDGAVDLWSFETQSKRSCVTYSLTCDHLPAARVKNFDRTQPTDIALQFALQPIGNSVFYGPEESPAHPWPIWQKAGFQVIWRNRPPDPRNPYEATVLRVAIIPHWFILLLCLPFPLLWFRRYRRRRYRLRHGLCPVCSYDLRASPGKCPECGASAENLPPAPASPPAAPAKI